MSLVSPPAFSAQPDKLRLLAHGRNDALLDTWVAQVFSGWKWDEQAASDLARLAAHPHLPPQGLARARLPQVALRDPDAMEAAVAAGLDPRNIAYSGKAASARAAALEENAPPRVHAVLDGAATPAATLAEVARALPRAARQVQMHSMEHLLDRHRDFCLQAFLPAEQSALLMFALENRARTNGNDAPHRAVDDPKAWSYLLRRLAVWGVDWEPAIAACDNPKWEGLLHAEWAAARAQVLDAVLAPPSLASTPRPRPRM